MNLRHPAFFICALLYVVLRTYAGFGLQAPLVHGHLTDLLCMPLVLTCGQCAIRALFPWFQINALLAWATCAVFAIWFEWLLPAQDIHHTADLLDVVCYAFGTWTFVRLNRQPFTRDVLAHGHTG